MDNFVVYFSNFCLLISFMYHVFKREKKFKSNKSVPTLSSSSVSDRVVNIREDCEETSSVKVID